MTYQVVFKTPVTSGGKARKATKRDLVEAVTAAPHDVFLRNLSMFPNRNFRNGESGYADELLVGCSVQVVGPDAQRERKWYATISRSAKGLTVK